MDPVLVVVARLEGTVNTSLAEIRGQLNIFNERTGSTGTRLEDVEKRVTSLEAWRNWIAGALAVLGVIGGALVGFVFLHGHISITT